jgi:hypothetical protein
MNEVVRVATSNNFNCTPKEWAQLDHFAQSNPNKSFFINSNINTPKLRTAVDHTYKIVVTANPDLLVKNQSGIISRLEAIKAQIAFVRVKYLPNNNPINCLISELISDGYPVVLILQRFNGKKSLTQYTDIAFYKFSCSRYRLAGEELKKITSIVEDLQAGGFPVWICDQSGKGCQGCGLCSKLTTGQVHKITSLNLNASGICPYHCPDCYAKTMQHFCTSLGHSPIVYDTIRQNDKQAGKTKHIQEAKRAN